MNKDPLASEDPFDDELDEELSRRKSMAKLGLLPTVNASHAIEKSLKSRGYDPDFEELVLQLRRQVSEANKGNLNRSEACLVAQTHTLDNLFSALTSRAIANMNEGYGDAAERYLRLAFKAQQQCSNTIRALGELKKPKSLMITGQANIATNQQVNFKSSVGQENLQNKLFEGEHEQVDIRAKREPESGNSTVETVAAIDGAKDRRG